VSYPGTLESVNFRGGCKLCQIAGPHQFCALHRSHKLLLDRVVD